MGNFFKYVFASMLGFVLSFIVIGILLVAIVASLVNSVEKDETVTVAANSVLYLDLDEPITERAPRKSPLDRYFDRFERSTHLGLKQILAGIKKAKTDDNIKGIYLDAQQLQAGQATIEEVRNALLDFKKSGKFIIAYSEIYTQSAYYLASVADKIYINPEGILEFKGFRSKITFFKGALAKLEIEPQIIKVGTYKSAVEPLVLDKMSEPNREQVTAFMGSMYGHFISRISESRKVPKDSLLAIANDLKVRNADLAVSYKLADAVKYKDEVLNELKTKTGIDAKADVKAISIKDYDSEEEDKEVGDLSDQRIAIVYANGDISGGEGNDESIGSERISRAIRKVRTDKKVKAVVLRINSPGGSSLASDVIWREVALTKKVKPVVVSMGDVAASGGYYIACAADSIFAQPNTITGSIGVFGIIPNMQKFFNNKLGVTFDGVKTSEHADLGSITRPLTQAEKLIIQKEVDRIYETFIKRVAEGRRKKPEYINSIGQGRVWSGIEALNNGLVDRLGSVNDAIKSAAKMAKLKDYKVVDYPTQKDKLEAFFGESPDKIRDYFAQKELGEHYAMFKQLKKAINFNGIQARLPYDISVQ